MQEKFNFRGILTLDGQIGSDQILKTGSGSGLISKIGSLFAMYILVN